MNRIYALAIALAALLCGGSSAQAQSGGYYYHYSYYYGGVAYPLPQTYYVYYPTYTYAPPPVWFTPPAPAPVVNVTINVNPAPVVVAPAVIAPAKEWKTVYPKWAKTVLGKQLNDELWLGADRYKLHEGSGVPPLPSKLLPNELFVETYTRDGMTLFDVHHLSGGKSIYKKVSK